MATMRLCFLRLLGEVAEEDEDDEAKNSEAHENTPYEKKDDRDEAQLFHPEQHMPPDGNV